MEHYFELPVTYKGELLQLKGRLVTFAYSYKFYIVVSGRELVFEKDDEGKYRVVSDGNTSQIDPHLMEAIVSMLENIATLDQPV